jgi:hypothetical protein
MRFVVFGLLRLDFFSLDPIEYAAAAAKKESIFS